MLSRVNASKLIHSSARGGHLPIRPIFIPERARALSADWAPGPGVLVLGNEGLVITGCKLSQASSSGMCTFRKGPDSKCFRFSRSLMVYVVLSHTF